MLERCHNHFCSSKFFFPSFHDQPYSNPDRNIEILSGRLARAVKQWFLLRHSDWEDETYRHEGE